MKLLRKDNKNYAMEELKEAYVDRLVFGMLKNNRLGCLLPMNFRFVDDIVAAEYDITGMQPLSRVYESRKIDSEAISSIVHMLWVAGREMEEYLMRGENLCLDPDFIFSDMEGEKLYFCCRLETVAEDTNPYRVLLSFIMDRVDYGMKEAVGLAYSLVRAAEGEDPLGAMEELVKKEIKDCAEPVQRDEGEAYTEMPEFMPQKKKKGFWWGRKKQKKQKKQLLITEIRNIPMIEENRGQERFVTKPLDSRQQERHYYLQPLGGEHNTKLEMDHFPYTIGKLEEADYKPESPMVSRLHARFDMSENGLVIEDLNSSNGTYVNSTSIFGSGRVGLRDGDCISFADLNFRLEIYGGHFSVR